MIWFDIVIVKMKFHWSDESLISLEGYSVPCTLFVSLGESDKCQNVWTDLTATNASFPMEYLWTDQFEKFSSNSLNRKVL